MTLKARLLIAVSVIAVVLVVAAVAVTRTTEHYLVDQVDQQLARFAGPSERSTAPGGRIPAAIAAPGTTLGAVDGRGTRSVSRFLTQPEWFDPTDDEPDGARFSAVYVGVFAGSRLGTSLRPARAGEGPAVPEIDRVTADRLARDESVVSVGAVDGDTRYRLTARRSGDGALVVVAAPLADVEASMRRLVTVEAVAGGLVLLVLGLLTWWVLRLGVRPVQRMTEAATAAAGGALDGRMPAAPAGTEAGELGRALNTMLERIAHLLDERVASEQRLRQFLSDASHELRTPVTTIRGYAELYRSGALGAGEPLAAAMARTESEAMRLGRLLDDMTTLARLDERRARVTEDVDLDVHVDDAVTDLRMAHPDRPVHTSLGPARVHGDPDALDQVVTNLLSNAVHHTPPRTPLAVRLSTSGDVVRLAVVDHGPGVSPETARRAFERFYRADPSRSRASGGSGLGLAIVAAIVAAHGGTAAMEARSADDPDGRGTTVLVELPAAGRAPDAGDDRDPRAVAAGATVT